MMIARALAVADPRSAAAKRDVGVSLAMIAGLAPTQVRWSQVYEHFLAMQRDGLLAAADQGLLAISKQEADDQDRTVPQR